MPIITAIKHQKRVGSNRFNISVDGNYAFTISDLELSNSGLRVGQELTAEEVEQFTDQAKGAKAYALALRYVGARLRSRRELNDYLLRKGCAPEDIEQALERLEGLGLVNDVTFAKAWVADRMSIRPRSKLRLSQELAAKGVSRDDMAAALDELEPDDELRTLKELIERKRRASNYTDEKLLGYLQRQGYRWSLIKEALDQLSGEN